VSPDSSYALLSIIPDKLRVAELTPIPVMKAIKNPVEIQGMNIYHRHVVLKLIQYTYATVYACAHWQAFIGAFIDIFEKLFSNGVEGDYVSLSLSLSLPRTYAHAHAHKTYDNLKKKCPEGTNIC
jgi:hypothetical protein